jgi:hypothetical protein
MTGAWGFSAKSKQGKLTGPDQKLPQSQINVLRASMWLQVDGGLSPEAGQAPHRVHRAVCTEIKKLKGGFEVIVATEQMDGGLFLASPPLTPTACSVARRIFGPIRILENIKIKERQ